MDQTISRRSLLAAAAGLLTLPTLASAQRPARMRIVLLHGAWHGGWCWRKVVPLLRERGHDVWVPTLSGLGERRHLARPEIGLTTHVEDLVAVLETEDLRDVVLVVHSYAGMVAGGAAKRQQARLRQIIFVDGLIPQPGRSVQDNNPKVNFDDIANQLGAGWRVPMSAVYSLAALGIRDPADVAWMQPRICDQPVRTFTDPSSVLGGTLDSVPCSFVSVSSIPGFVRASERAASLGWPVRKIQGAGHDAMVTRPRELVDVLLGLAGTAP